LLVVSQTTTTAGIYRGSGASAGWERAGLPAVSSIGALSSGYARGAPIHASSSAGVLTSRDAGATWRLNPGSPRFGTLGASASGRTVIAATTDPSLGGPVAISRDAGASWAGVAVRFGGHPVTSWDPGLISVAPRRASHAYLGLVRGQTAATPRGEVINTVVSSADGGRTWHAARRAPKGRPQALGVVPSHPRIAFTGTTAGLYRTDDGGRTWRRVPEASAGPVSAIAVSPGPRWRVIALSRRLFISEAGGGSWSHRSLRVGGNPIYGVTARGDGASFLLVGFRGVTLFRPADSVNRCTL